MNPLTPAQIRGARGLLNWSLTKLARAADLSAVTVRRVESGDLDPIPASIEKKLRDALSKEGIVFLPDGGDGVGVRLNAPTQTRSGGGSDA